MVPSARQRQKMGSRTKEAAGAFPDRHTIENRFAYEIDEGRSDGQIRLKGEVFKAAMDGNMRALGTLSVRRWSALADSLPGIKERCQHSLVLCAANIPATSRHSHET